MFFVAHSNDKDSPRIKAYNFWHYYSCFDKQNGNIRKNNEGNGDNDFQLFHTIFFCVQNYIHFHPVGRLTVF